MMGGTRGIPADDNLRHAELPDKRIIILLAV